MLEKLPNSVTIIHSELQGKYTCLSCLARRLSKPYIYEYCYSDILFFFVKRCIEGGASQIFDLFKRTYFMDDPQLIFRQAIIPHHRFYIKIIMQNSTQIWIRFQTHLFPLLPNICYICFNMMYHGILNSKTKFVSKLLKSIAKYYEKMHQTFMKTWLF